MNHPKMAFPLPGRWFKVSASDPEGRGHIVNAVSQQVNEESGADLAARLGGFAAAGGDMVLLRTGTVDPALLLTSWPPEREDERVPGVDNLRARVADHGAGAETVDLENKNGYAAVRTVREVAADSPARVTYWVSDPEVGRLFCMDVTYLGRAAGDVSRDDVPWTEPYDSVVEHLRWEEPTGDE